MALPLVPFVASIGAFFQGSSLFSTGLKILIAGAFKLLLITLFTVTLSIVLKNFGIDWILSGFQLLFDSLDLEIPPFVINLTGLGAWIGQLLRLPDALSIVISGMLIGLFRSILKI